MDSVEVIQNIGECFFTECLFIMALNCFITTKPFLLAIIENKNDLFFSNPPYIKVYYVSN